MMKRMTWCTALALAAFIGCGEPESPPDDGMTPIEAINENPSSPEVEPGAATATSTETPAEKTDLATPGAGLPSDYPGKEKKVEEGDDNASDLPPPASAKEEPAAEKPEEDQTAAVELSEDEIAEIKKLPEDQQKLALAQALCPLSGENLGSMGKPVVKTVGDKTVFLCCKGCEEEFDKDPEAVLAKLENQ